jgi:hypothetical protein
MSARGGLFLPLRRSLIVAQAPDPFLSHHLMLQRAPDLSEVLPEAVGQRRKPDYPPPAG